MLEVKFVLKFFMKVLKREYMTLLLNCETYGKCYVTPSQSPLLQVKFGGDWPWSGYWHCMIWLIVYMVICHPMLVSKKHTLLIVTTCHPALQYEKPNLEGGKQRIFVDILRPNARVAEDLYGATPIFRTFCHLAHPTVDGQNPKQPSEMYKTL